MATLESLRARQAEIAARNQEIEIEANGERFTDSQKDEWNDLNEEFEANRAHIEELEARKQRLEDLVQRGSVETETRAGYSRGVKKRVPDDPSDLVAYRSTAHDIDELHEAYKEGALRLSETMVPAHDGADIEKSRARVEHLIRNVDSPNDPVLSKRIIATSSPTYLRAFSKKVSGSYLTPEEERAMSLTTTAGGFAVPYTLDPTIILTSAGVINPVRGLARQVTITGNNWLGVSSTGVTAAYSAEATEASDNAPTLAQPSLTVEKAQCFVPFSIEIGEDYGSLQTELARLFSDAKDTLENTQFLTGLGHASNVPQGLIAVGGATAVVSTATTAVIASADIYSLIQGLSPRFRARAQFVGNRATFDKIRQFDTGGGANLWVQLAYDAPPTLVGFPATEWSAYSSATTTSGSTVLSLGDFSHFVIVDRAGMNLELIPHMFATGNNRPSGQRGVYAWWRNSSIVTAGGLQANSAFVSLKVL